MLSLQNRQQALFQNPQPFADIGAEVDSPGTPGLDFAQLSTLLRTLVGSGRVIGLDACIYDPDLDRNQRYAKPIADCLAAALR